MILCWNPSISGSEAQLVEVDKKKSMKGKGDEFGPPGVRWLEGVRIPRDSKKSAVTKREWHEYSTDVPWVKHTKRCGKKSMVPLGKWSTKWWVFHIDILAYRRVWFGKPDNELPFLGILGMVCQCFHTELVTLHFRGLWQPSLGLARTCMFDHVCI